MDLYRDFIIDLYKNPLNKRNIAQPDIVHSGVNVTCGDRVRMYALLNKKGEIKDCAFEGAGCAIAIAAASLITEEAKGKPLAGIATWNSQTIFDLLGVELSAARIKCGLLALETLQEGIKKN